MVRKPLFVLFACALLAAACAPETPEVVVTLPPIQPPTAEQLPLPASPTPAPLVPAAPTNAPDCKDAAVFVEDVTIPDLENLQPGEAFTKTWRLRNSGTCSWGPDYSLVFASGDQMQSSDFTPLAVTAPGDTLDVSVNLTAPALGGIYTGIYEIHNPAGKVVPVGTLTNVWVKVSVGLAPAEAGTGSTPSGPCKPVADSASISQLLELINQARNKEGLHDLKLNSRLSAAAQAHSEDMACNNFHGHTGSNGSSISARVAKQGYLSSYLVENIYVGGTAQNAFDWWMEDQPHRDVILNPEVTEIGIGHAFLNGSTYGNYFTADFASP